MKQRILWNFSVLCFMESFASFLKFSKVMEFTTKKSDGSPQEPEAATQQIEEFLERYSFKQTLWRWSSWVNCVRTAQQGPRPGCSLVMLEMIPRVARVWDIHILVD